MTPATPTSWRTAGATRQPERRGRPPRPRRSSVACSAPFPLPAGDEEARTHRIRASSVRAAGPLTGRSRVCSGRSHRPTRRSPGREVSRIGAAVNRSERMILVDSMVTPANGTERRVVWLPDLQCPRPLMGELIQPAMRAFAARADREPGEKRARAKERHRQDRDDGLRADHLSGSRGTRRSGTIRRP